MRLIAASCALKWVTPSCSCMAASWAPAARQFLPVPTDLALAYLPDPVLQLLVRQHRASAR